MELLDQLLDPRGESGPHAKLRYQVPRSARERLGGLVSALERSPSSATKYQGLPMSAWEGS